MYSEIVELLKTSKARRYQAQARDTLQQVVAYLEQAPCNTKFRNKLIADREYIFPVAGEEVYQTFGLDYTFSTSGYLNQVINSLGVANGEEYVRKLQEAIEDLHSAISSGQECTEERQSFEQVLEQFKILIE